VVRKASSVRMGKGFAFNRTLTPILAVRKVQVADHYRSDALRQQTVPEQTLEPWWGGRAHAGGEEQERAESEGYKAIVACARGKNGLLRGLRLPRIWHGR